MTAPAQTTSGVGRSITTVVVVCLVLAALATFVWNAIETSSARVNATTEANSVFSAGTVDLAQPNTLVELLFDATNLYPGAELAGCVVVEYRGSVPADVRLHAQMLGGSGLDEFIDMRATTPAVDTCDDVTIESAALLPAIYDGTLGTFWRTHNSYGSGIDLGEMSAGDLAVLHVTAGLIDDNDAQGRTTDFSLTVEARP